MNLREQLAAKEAEAEQLRREIARADCATAGCDMRHIGGANAGCDRERDCMCSVPIHECTKCGACDYGDNDEGNEVREECAKARAEVFEGAS